MFETKMMDFLWYFLSAKRSPRLNVGFEHSIVKQITLIHLVLVTEAFTELTMYNVS